MLEDQNDVYKMTLFGVRRRIPTKQHSVLNMTIFSVICLFIFLFTGVFALIKVFKAKKADDPYTQQLLLHQAWKLDIVSVVIGAFQIAAIFLQ